MYILLFIAGCIMACYIALPIIAFCIAVIGFIVFAIPWVFINLIRSLAYGIWRVLKWSYTRFYKTKAFCNEYYHYQKELKANDKRPTNRD